MKTLLLMLIVALPVFAQREPSPLDGSACERVYQQAALLDTPANAAAFDTAATVLSRRYPHDFGEVGWEIFHPRASTTFDPLCRSGLLGKVKRRVADLKRQGKQQRRRDANRDRDDAVDAVRRALEDRSAKP